MMRRTIAALAAAGALAGCSVGHDLPAVHAAVGVFHQEFNAQDFAKIYSDSGPDFKNASSQGDFTQLLSAIHRKLGNYVSGNAGGWTDNVNTSGHFVTAGFSATFERGAAEESFVYRIDSGKALLAGYHISSNALITN
jgi:hypothetical protein